MIRAIVTCALVVGFMLALAAHAHAQLPPVPLPPLPDPLPAPSPDAPPSQPPVDPTPAPPEEPTPPAPASPSSPGEDAAFSPEDWISPSELARETPGEVARRAADEIVPAAYPRELVRRPLLLPAGGREVAIGFGIGRDAQVARAWGTLVPAWSLTYGMLDISGRYSTGKAELFVGGDLVVFESQEITDYGSRQEIPTVRSLYAGVTILTHDETAIGVEMLLGHVDADHPRFAPSLFLLRRIPLSAWSAIRLGGGISYHEQTVQTSGHDLAVRRGSIYGSVAVQAQATPVLGFQVSATYVQYKYLEDYGLEDSAYRDTTYGASSVISISDNVDLVPYLGIYATWPGDGKIACLTLIGRWLP